MKNRSSLLLVIAPAMILLLCSFTDGKVLYNSSESNSSGSSEEPLNLGTEENLDACSHYIVEKEYILLENGSLMLPGSDSIYAYETYFVQNDTAFLCVDDEQQTLPVTDTGTAFNFSQEFLK